MDLMQKLRNFDMVNHHMKLGLKVTFANILKDKYEILEAENGKEALDILAKKSGSIALMKCRRKFCARQDLQNASFSQKKALYR